MSVILTLYVALLCLSQIVAHAGIVTNLYTVNKIGEYINPLIKNSLLKFAILNLLIFTFGQIIVLCNQLGDRFGHKTVLISGWYLIGGLTLIPSYLQIPDSSLTSVFIESSLVVGYFMILSNGMWLLRDSYPENNFIRGLMAVNVPLGVLAGVVSLYLPLWKDLKYMLGMGGICLAIGFYFIIKEGKQTSTWKQIFNMPDFGVPCVTISFLLAIKGNVDSFTWSPNLFVLVIMSIVIYRVGYTRILECLRTFLRFLLRIKIGLIWGSIFFSLILLWNFLNFCTIQQGVSIIHFVGIIAVLAIFVPLVGMRSSSMLIISFAVFCFIIAFTISQMVSIQMSFFGFSLVQIYILCFSMDLGFPSGSIIVTPIARDRSTLAITCLLNLLLTAYLSSSIKPDTKFVVSDIIDNYKTTILFSIGMTGTSAIVCLVLSYIESAFGQNEKEKVQDVEESV
ncbi:uncharacterized protein RJT21DRAFT_50578 [Scheffersomyces amazonensis]|uniref:uncharacterized protein n=1 Tax=Scheffersomyces amazonensis TaxID=1078765 RepID=UPI00315DE728